MLYQINSTYRNRIILFNYNYFIVQYKQNNVYSYDLNYFSEFLKQMELLI